MTAEGTSPEGGGADEVSWDAGLLSPVRAGTPAEAAVSDHAWLQAMLDAEAALVRAQAKVGTVPGQAARVISRAARAERLDLRSLALEARETANPVVGLVGAFRRVVAAEDPAAAEYVHRGSTSQDIFDTGAMLVAARTLRLVRADLARCTEALAGLARRHRETPMAGRTLTLHAVPTTFGLKAAGWRELLRDADRRLERLLGTGLPVSLGGAAGTLSGYGEYALMAAEPDGRSAAEPAALAEAFAAETGLVAPTLPWHALRTPMADLAAALAFTATALGKIAVDVQSLARTEVGEVGEPRGAEHGSARGSSSAMPQKRNPVLSTLLRTAALQVPALATTLTQCVVTEDERAAGVWHAEWLPLRECLRLTGGAAHTAVELTGGLEIHPARMRRNLALTGSQIVAERLSARLAPHLGAAGSKRLLAEASAEAARSDTPLAAVLAADPGVSAHFTPAALTALCDPAAYTAAAPALTDRALDG